MRKLYSLNLNIQQCLVLIVVYYYEGIRIFQIPAEDLNI